MELNKKESCLNRLGHDFFCCNLRYIFPIFFLNNNKIRLMNLVPIKINRWDDATDFQYRFGCHRRRQSRKMEGNSGWFGLNKREYKLEISSLFHFRQKSAKNQKNNESFLEKVLKKTFKSMEVMRCPNGLNKITWMKITCMFI